MDDGLATASTGRRLIQLDQSHGDGRGRPERRIDFPAVKNEIEQSLRRAQQWLLAAEPKSAEERGMRLMGLVWTDAPRPRIEAAIRDVRTRQEADGGWSQFGRTAPDAYATGLSLYALCVAGVPPTDDSYRKGSRSCWARSIRTGPGW